MDILTVIVFTLFLSLILNLILKKISISPIVGYIFTGVIIVSFTDFVHINHQYVNHIAEYGIVFLMFTIGLEFSVSHLKQMKKEVFVFGSLQVTVTTAIFTLIANKFFALDMKTSLVIGSALALSSTAIVLKVLNENGDIHRPYGRNSVGILIFQDLAVIPILLMITILADANKSLGDMVLNTLISAVLVGVILFIVGFYLLEKFLAYVVDSRTEELFIVAILLLVLSSAWLAHSFGFSHSLGAFLAGMLIAETKYKYQIESDLVPFRDILLGIFFISVGMQVNLVTIFNNFFLIVGLSIAIHALKVIIIFFIVRIFTFTKRAIKTALALAQVGEFSFAVFALASTNNLIDNQLNQIMISVVIISLIFTSLVVRHVRAFVNFFQRETNRVSTETILDAGIKNHVIICGYSQLGQKIIKNLKNFAVSYVAVEHDRQLVKKGKENGDSVFFGNAASKHILNALYLKDATSVIIAIDNDDKIRLITEAIKAINPNVHIVVKVTHQAQIDEFKDLEVDGFVNENELVAYELIKKAMQCNIK